MNYSDPLRPQRQSRHPAFAQYEDSYQSYQDARIDFRSGSDRAPWEAEPRGTASRGRDTAAHSDLPRRTTGSLRAIPNLPRQTTGAMRVLSEAGQPADREAGAPRQSRGLLAGAVAGFLAAAVAIGTGNLAAAFVRPQASPIIAVGETFINHTPSALKNFAVEKFGENDKTMLLLGMYVTIALIAIALGMLAWRRIAVGVAGIGLFGLFGAYVAITLPASHATDVIPSVISGVVGITAIVWLVHAGKWRTPHRSARSAYRTGRSA